MEGLGGPPSMRLQILGAKPHQGDLTAVGPARERWAGWPARRRARWEGRRLVSVRSRLLTLPRFRFHGAARAPETNYVDVSRALGKCSHRQRNPDFSTEVVFVHDAARRQPV